MFQKCCASKSPDGQLIHSRSYIMHSVRYRLLQLGMIALLLKFLSVVLAKPLPACPAADKPSACCQQEGGRGWALLAGHIRHCLRGRLHSAAHAACIHRHVHPALCVQALQLFRLLLAAVPHCRQVRMAMWGATGQEQSTRMEGWRVESAGAEPAALPPPPPHPPAAAGGRSPGTKNLAACQRHARRGLK